VTAYDLQPGQRVRIVQTIDRRDRDWRTTVTGVVRAVEPQKTGSWFAHGKDDKLWLLRVRLVKDDGEVTVLNVDPRTRIEALAPL
jgi:hypothetical protein